jgi:hypothetical protein
VDRLPVFEWRFDMPHQAIGFQAFGIETMELTASGRFTAGS